MNRSERLSTASTLAVGVVALAATALIVVAASSTPSANAASSSSDWADSLGVLSDEQTKADVIPGNFDVDPQLRATAHYLGAYEKASLWAGTDRAGDPCLLATFDGPMNIASSSCGGESSFLESGLGIQANTLDGAVVAYLLPDAVAGAQSTQELTAVHPNLLVGDPFAAAQVSEKLRSSNGTAFVLPAFGEPEDFREPAE